MARNKKNADGRYRYRVYLGKNEDGSKKFKSFYGSTEREAKAAAAAYRTAIGASIQNSPRPHWAIYTQISLLSKKLKALARRALTVMKISATTGAS